MNLLPRVLIAAPTSERHKHLIDDWLKSLEDLDYANIRVCLVDTTVEDPNFTKAEENTYFSHIKEKKVKGHEIISWRRPWDPKQERAIQMLAYVREDIRKFFIEHKEFDYLFWLDDDVFIPKDSIQRLLSYRKDLVGFYVHVYYKPKRRPCVFKSGEIILGKGLEYYTFSEILRYKRFVKALKSNKLTHEEKLLVPFLIRDKWHPNLFQPYAVNLGCCMCSRKVSEVVPFRTHPSFVMGEDLWWFSECNDKGFQFWCDCEVRPIHKNTPWKDVNDVELRTKGKTGIVIAHGPENAEGLLVIDRGQESAKKLKEGLKNEKRL